MLDNVSLAFDDKVVLRDVSFELLPGHTKIILGASGSGKSTILKLILGLLKPDGGDDLRQRRARGHDERAGADEGARRPRHGVPGRRALRLADRGGERRLQAVRGERHAADEEAQRRVEEVLGFVGLQEYIDRMPSELSGGQRRRVAIARAMAAKPGILLYDEATTGLDPITATTVDEEIIKLRDLEGVSSIVVTHQLRDAFFVATHEAVRQSGQHSDRAGRRRRRPTRRSSSC